MRIPYFDAHCDTPLPMYSHGEGLEQNRLHLDLRRLSAFAPCAQVFSVCTEYGPNVLAETENVILNFLHGLKQCEACIELCRASSDLGKLAANGKIAALLSVEGADRIGCSLAQLQRFYDLGIRVIHLTWNEDNALCGAALGSGSGLTALGRSFVTEAQRMGIALDMSHISEQGFWDVLEIAEKPILAGHSNSYALCSHPRNLTDAQFLALAKNGGVAGVNLYPNFLGLTRDMDAVIAHVEHWLSLGGEDAVCLGTDFDGVDQLPDGMEGLQSMEKLYEAMLRNRWSEALVQKIFYHNLCSYFGRAL